MKAPEKLTLTRDEVAAMAPEDLRRMDGCPQQGIKVVVYGDGAAADLRSL
jgi:hypothetical protein